MSDGTPTAEAVATEDGVGDRAPAAADVVERVSANAVWSVVERVAWFVVPIVSVIWLSSRYNHSWYLLDEFPFINRTTASGTHWPEPVSGSWLDAFEGFHGHLHVVSYAVYRAQQAWFGIEGHELVFATFCASLVGLQLTMAAVLRRLGIPVLIALAAATVFTFFGAGAQNMVWQFQLNANIALTLSFAGALVVLRSRPTPFAAASVAALLVLAVGADSALAALGAVYVGILLVWLWPRRLLAVALVAPGIANVAWLAFGEKNDILTAGHTTDIVPVGTTLRFAGHMFLLAAGGIAGGREVVGILAAVAATACVVFGLVRGRLSRPVVASLVGGLAVAFLTIAVIAKRMAYAYVPSELPGSRYVHWVAIFLVVALVPAIVATLRPVGTFRSIVAGSVVIIALGAVFALNLDEMRRVRNFHESFGLALKGTMRQTVGVLVEGCGPDARVDPKVVPQQAIPHFRVRLVQTLLRDGAIDPSFGTPPSPEVRAAVCQPIASR